MNTYRGIIAIGLLLAAAGVGNAQSGRAADRREIAGDYARSSQAMLQKDLKPLSAVMTKDATFKEANGSVVSRPQFFAMMKQAFATLTYTEITPKVTKWTWQGNAALVDVTIHSAGTIKTPDGKTHSVTYVSTSRDAWVKQADGWRLQQIKALSEAMTTQDGKPVVTPAPKK